MSDPKNYFLAIVFIACFTCLERPDYNLPLFVFAYILWDHDKTEEKYQRIRFSYLFLFSCAIDICWVVIWSVLWFQDAASIDIDSLVLHICIVCTSSLELILKFIVIPVILKNDESVRSSLSCLARLYCLKKKEKVNP